MRRYQRVDVGLRGRVTMCDLTVEAPRTCRRCGWVYRGAAAHPQHACGVQSPDAARVQPPAAVDTASVARVRETSPRANYPKAPIGLGTIIARFFKRIGIKPCGGCRKRQRILDQRFPLE